MQNTLFKQQIFCLLLVVAGWTSCVAQDTVLYKQIDTTKLFLETHYPKKMEASKKYPAVVFFFGGGWIGGDRSAFRRQANYLAKRGMVCFLADYRIRNKNNTTPFDALKDAKSAMRFVRKHAAKFHVNPTEIVASGGSAGGQLAAATALIDGYNAKTDDLSVSCVPNSLVLFYPVIDNGPGGYGYDRIGEAYKEFSPLHNIKRGAPPTIIFCGTQDHLIPVETLKYYQMVMKKVGSRCELKLYKGQDHAFLSQKYFKKTILETDKFLKSLGYLK